MKRKKRQNKQTQIVMRISQQLDKKIRAAAKKEGLKKAGWLRRLAIKTLESLESTPKNS